MKQLMKVAVVGETMFGTSANGDWERKQIVFEDLNGEGRMVPVDFFGKKKVKNLEGLQVGTYAEVSFSIDGRQHEGRWYPQLNGISATPMVRGEIKDTDND